MDSYYDDDNLAPVMPAIDAVQQLLEEESRNKLAKEKIERHRRTNDTAANDRPKDETNPKLTNPTNSEPSKELIGNTEESYPKQVISQVRDKRSSSTASRPPAASDIRVQKKTSPVDFPDEEDSFLIRNNPLTNFINQNNQSKSEEYEFVPKSAILDVYSNDPEVKRFLKQLPKIGTEFGYNEQDYKCYSCRRPVGMLFGQSKLCYFDGHHYCEECHLGEKSSIPAKIICNWDFAKYPISKRNQHFLTLISNEPMFELKTMAPLLYKNCPELREIEELRCQAFFIRSYLFTCVQDSISFELTKLVWPREHLIKQIDLYSLEDLIQIKSGTLKQVLKNVISFGRQHVLSCMLCCQKGFICELCKSSQIIYPFDTETVHRCNSCQSIYHKTCFKSKSTICDACPRCQRLKARRDDN